MIESLAGSIILTWRWQPNEHAIRDEIGEHGLADVAATH